MPRIHTKISFLSQKYLDTSNRDERSKSKTEHTKNKRKEIYSKICSNKFHFIFMKLSCLYAWCERMCEQVCVCVVYPYAFLNISIFQTLMLFVELMPVTSINIMSRICYIYFSFFFFVLFCVLMVVCFA